MSTLLKRLRSDERGFSMVTVMLMLLTLTGFAGAAWAASNGDISVSAADQHRDAAYTAAEAGINYYLYHLNQDTSYWAKCTNVPNPGGGPNPVVQAWNGVGPDTRAGHWRSLPNNNGQYAIELLPSSSKYTACDPTNQLSMYDGSSGTFSIRSTGLVAGKKRSLIASFRHRGFLDFLYFTDYETQDPVVSGVTSVPCNVYKRDGRSSSCPTIDFVSGDAINGPVHTNDQFSICGSPTFGRTAAGGGPDQTEISAPSPGYTAGSSCTASPNFTKPPALTGVRTIGMPPTNASLANLPGTTMYSGVTYVTLNNNGTMTVTNNGATNTVSWPSNGVLYVGAGAGGCATPYDGTPNYADSPGCPNVYVQGNYSQSLTIATAGDVIMTGNIVGSNNAVLGLIPQGFARVFHPVQGNCGSNYAAGSTVPNVPSSIKAPGQGMRIDAAILTLNDSFIADNWACGAPLGNLTVNGAIAQRFRGTVGTHSGSTVTSGYVKDYHYDDRLKYLSPPYFLDPVQSAWEISRQTEQLPAR